ncbi:MAG TPA: hypothetical protein VFE01_04755, partial [Terracidiphilus sp.]|nr:hypothetical protein [Terracidiphilus sp.]
MLFPVASRQYPAIPNGQKASDLGEDARTRIFFDSRNRRGGCFFRQWDRRAPRKVPNFESEANIAATFRIKTRNESPLGSSLGSFQNIKMIERFASLKIACVLWALTGIACAVHAQTYQIGSDTSKSPQAKQSPQAKKEQKQQGSSLGFGTNIQ